jgi:hypothetical protein
MKNETTVTTQSINKVIDPKTNVVYNVEKVKNNSIPKHFFSAEKKSIEIAGHKVEVMMNKERTQYVAFAIGDQSYYVRNHNFFEGAKYVEVVKPTPAAKVEKKEVVEEVKS